MILTHHGINSSLDKVLIGDKYYKSVKIGDRIWLAENLDYGSSGVYYNNDESTYGWNGLKYGKLYTWNEAVAAGNAIIGWHLPSSAEWDALANAVGGSDVAGTKLKSTTGWTFGNGDGSYGFEAFPSGYQRSGSFYGLGSYADFWTATEYSSSYAYRRLFNTGASVNSNYYDKTIYGFSVRLVKDLSSSDSKGFVNQDDEKEIIDEKEPVKDETIENKRQYY